MAAGAKRGWAKNCGHRAAILVGDSRFSGRYACLSCQRPAGHPPCENECGKGPYLDGNAISAGPIRARPPEFHPPRARDLPCQKTGVQPLPVGTTLRFLSKWRNRAINLTGALIIKRKPYRPISGPFAAPIQQQVILFRINRLPDR